MPTMPKKTVRRVALAGYMGVGKTTVARALAELWGCHVIDLDAEIVAVYGPIAEQFAQEGEAEFRRREADILQRVLASRAATDDLVLALGGGALVQAGTRQMLRQARVTTVYLRMPLWLGWSRVQADLARPLVKQGGYAQYRERFVSRRASYRRCDLCVDAYPVSPTCLAVRIDTLLPRRVIRRAF